MRRLNSSGRFIFRGGPIELVYRLEVNGTLIVSFAKLPFTFPQFAISVFTRYKAGTIQFRSQKSVKWSILATVGKIVCCVVVKEKKTQSINCYRRRSIHIHVYIYLSLPSYLLFIVFYHSFLLCCSCLWSSFTAGFTGGYVISLYLAFLKRNASPKVWQRTF